MIALLTLLFACAPRTPPAPAAEPPPVSGCDCCYWGMTGAPPTGPVEVPPLPESCVTFLATIDDQWCALNCPLPQ